MLYSVYIGLHAFYMLAQSYNLLIELINIKVPYFELFVNFWIQIIREVFMYNSRSVFRVKFHKFL